MFTYQESLAARLFAAPSSFWYSPLLLQGWLTRLDSVCWAPWRSSFCSSFKLISLFPSRVLLNVIEISCRLSEPSKVIYLRYISSWKCSSSLINDKLAKFVQQLRRFSSWHFHIFSGPCSYFSFLARRDSPKLKNAMPTTSFERCDDKVPPRQVSAKSWSIMMFQLSLWFHLPAWQSRQSKNHSVILNLIVHKQLFVSVEKLNEGIIPGVSNPWTSEQDLISCNVFFKCCSLTLSKSS